MKQITANEFKAAVDLDPAWATTLTEPVEITTFCDMTASQITHLSPLLHFTGRNEDGDTASFHSCANLKVAEGHFNGYVSFIGAGIEKIGELQIAHPDIAGRAANFIRCKNLKVAEGTFPGYVKFTHSGITSVGNLVINGGDHQKRKADFTGCNLHLPAEFLGAEYLMDEAFRQKNLGRIATSKALKADPNLEI